MGWTSSNHLRMRIATLFQLFKLERMNSRDFPKMSQNANKDISVNSNPFQTWLMLLKKRTLSHLSNPSSQERTNLSRCSVFLKKRKPRKLHQLEPKMEPKKTLMKLLLLDFIQASHLQLKLLMFHTKHMWLQMVRILDI